MNGQVKCPSAAQLRAMLEECLPTEEVEVVSSHIGDCLVCQQTLDHLAAEDPTLQQCLCAAIKDTPSPESALWSALDQLEEIAKPSQHTHRTPLPEPLGAITAFLEPSTRPGHIGRLGHFELVRMIGRGGMGMVFLAHDPQLNRDVAIKILDPQLAQDEIARQRFCREARAAALVSDDNIVAVHQVSHEESHDLPYLVMQFVEGESLEDRLVREKKMPLEEVVRIGMQIAFGLAAAHEKGLIHRDVKPGNILLENGTDRVKLTDFGLARAVEDLRLTRSGMVAGTPLYMAPEQARGEELDSRADLFSLGVVLYEMATGSLPFQGKTPLAVLKRLADEPHPPVRQLAPEVPEWLAEIIDRLLAKTARQRYQSAREVAQILEQHHLMLRTSSPEHQVCPKARLRRKIIQLTLTAGVAGVVLTLFALGLLSRGWNTGTTNPQPHPEEVGPIPVAALRSDQGPVWGVANSPDGSIIAVATDHQGVKLWNPKTGNIEGTIPATGPVWGIAFSPDGKYFATGGEDKKVRIYEWPGRALLADPEQAAGIRALAFSADSKKLVTGGRGGDLTVYDATSGKRLLQWPAHKFITSVAFSPTDDSVASTGADGILSVWNSKTGDERFKSTPLGNGLLSVAYSPDGKTLATGGWDGMVRLWNSGTGELRGKLEAHKQDIWSISFCPGGKILATGSEDNTVRLWDIASQQERAVMKGHERTVYSVVITRDGKQMVSGSRDGAALLWDIPPVCYE